MITLLIFLHLVELLGLSVIINLLVSKGTTIMAAIDDLQTQVAQNTTVEESAVTLINGLAAQITAAGTDPAKLAALTANLNKSASDLAAAITANTPAAAPAPTT